MASVSGDRGQAVPTRRGISSRSALAGGALHEALLGCPSTSGSGRNSEKPTDVADGVALDDDLAARR